MNSIAPPAEPVSKGKTPVLLRGQVDRRQSRLVRRSVHPSSSILDNPAEAVEGLFVAHLGGLCRGRLDRGLSIRVQFRTSAGPGRRRGRRAKTTDLPACPHKPSKRDPRASLYKRPQDLWQKSRSTLAGAVLDGGSADSMGENVPEVNNVEQLFGGIFESVCPPDQEPLRYPKGSQPVFLPVTPEEVGAAKRGWSISAPGPDGIGVAQVGGRSDELAVLYTLILWKSSWGLLRPY